MANDQYSAIKDLENMSVRMQKMEDRYRTLINNVDVGICIAKMRFDANNRAVDYLIVDGNAAYERHTGLHGSIGKWVSEFAPDLERHWFDAYGNVALTGVSVQFENGAMPLGNRWFQVEAHRVGAPEDHEVAILFTDITARRAEKEQQKIVNRELAHRMRNFVAIVQSMVSQTLRQATSTEEAFDAINGRLIAFARAQDVLGEESLDGADIVDVVQSAVLPHQTEDGRINVTGPALELSARRALGLSLTLHELATNSVKYGALSCANGVVAIEWGLIDSELQLTWIELGGPEVSPPSSRGFGTRLIETVTQSSFSGTSTLAFDPTGVRFHLTAPLEMT